MPAINKVNTKSITLEQDDLQACINKLNNTIDKLNNIIDKLNVQVVSYSPQLSPQRLKAENPVENPAEKALRKLEEQDNL